jgi:trigger factor
MFDIGNMDDELELICEFSLIPKVELPDYKNSKINFHVGNVNESEINSYINELMKKDVILTPKETNVIENGDVVVFDFKGKIDGKTFPGGEANFYELEIGSNQFIPGFEQQMIGLKRDEKKTINVSFPNNYHAKEFAGKVAEFDLNIRDIKVSKKPDLDEEYIRSLNIKNVSNKDELNKYISKKLADEKKVENERTNLNLFYEYLKNNSKLSYLPDFLINKEKANLKEHLSTEAQKHNLSLNKYLEKNMNMSSDVEENLNQLAKQNIILIYSLREILKELNITISDQDVENYYEIMSTTFNMPIEQIKKMFENNENIKEVILQNKLIDKIVELNK